jgi:3-hydroxyisobutyrate dehydrogenase-like beta-hydroxyacid dehydrogenase
LEGKRVDLKIGDGIALIGLGLLGSALAGRLLHAGFRVAGFDVDRDARERFGRLGGIVAESARDAAAASKIVLLSLPNFEIAEQVVLEIAPEAAGRCILDTTTGPPAFAEAMAARIAESGGRYFDLTIAGSSAQVAAGAAVAMFGGTGEQRASLAPVLDCLAVTSFALGRPGSAARMKLVSNLVLGLHRAVLAEALVFASRLGLQPADALAVLRASSSYSRAMDAKGDKMLRGDFAPEARLHQHLKDVRLIREEASRSGAPIPLSHVHEALLQEAMERGFGDLDNSAIFQVYAVRGEAL